MKNLILAGIVVAALLGLAFVQYRLLRIGIQLEKERLDGQVMAALQNVSQRLDAQPELRRRLLRLQQSRFQPLAVSEQELPRQVADTLDLLLGSALADKGLQLPYTFAITESYLSYPILQVPGYPEETTAGRRPFSYLLKAKLRRECGCDFFLHLQAEGIFPVLLKRLYKLLIPSLAFILLLLLSLALLIRTLNQQKRLSHIKNDFINNLAHELKTPAFSIGLLSRLIEASIQDGNAAKSKEYLQLLEGENEQIKSQIEKVLELASLESGRYKLGREEVAIGPFLEKIAVQYRHKVENEGGRLRFYPSANGSRVLLDEAHLRNALQNLLDNAIKYGGHRPQVSLYSRREGKWLKVAVADKGPGIAPAHQKHLFDKFYRVPNGDLHVVKGFGLGLSYVRQVVRAHGGKVSVQSQPGQGSTFTISLPLLHPKPREKK